MRRRESPTGRAEPRTQRSAASIRPFAKIGPGLASGVAVSRSAPPPRARAGRSRAKTRWRYATRSTSGNGGRDRGRRRGVCFIFGRRSNVCAPGTAAAGPGNRSPVGWRRGARRAAEMAVRAAPARRAALRVRGPAREDRYRRRRRNSAHSVRLREGSRERLRSLCRARTTGDEAGRGGAETARKEEGRAAGAA